MKNNNEKSTTARYFYQTRITYKNKLGIKGIKKKHSIK